MSIGIKMYFQSILNWSTPIINLWKNLHYVQSVMIYNVAPTAAHITVNATRISSSILCRARLSPAKAPCIKSTAWVIGKRFEILLIVSGKSISGIVAPDRNSMIK